MVDPIAIIEKYYKKGTKLYDILVEHSKSVAKAALLVASHNKQFHLDRDFLYEAAMLHDIGIFLTDSPKIYCFGKHPYIAHGYLGRELLEREGLFKHGLVAERHTGTGLTIDDIQKQNLPIPLRNYLPESIEEKIICYADKFFSKSSKNLSQPKPIDKIEKSIGRYGEIKLTEFNQMVELFGVDYLYQ